MLLEMKPWQIAEQEFSCAHEQTQFVRFVKSNGAVCVREQCMQCGTSMREVPKIGHNVESLPEWDKSLSERWYLAKKNRRDNLFAQAQQENSQQWWSQYSQYLRSQHWFDLRKRVLERDHGLCQACLKNKAVQVHHISYSLYDQLGRSAGFELVSICYQCHKAIHPHMAEAQHDLALYNPYLG